MPAPTPATRTVTAQRAEAIADQIREQGFAGVRELAERHRVSEVTIRRDLLHLEQSGRARRVHGGAVGTSGESGLAAEPASAGTGETLALGSVLDRVDVLVTASGGSRFDLGLIERACRRGVPVIAESVSTPGARTLVAVDNLVAGADLGRWAGGYAKEHFGGIVTALDLSLDQVNTSERSRGFIAGLREAGVEIRQVLSVNAGAECDSARRITLAALEAHHEINLIFAINDTTAQGAIKACEDRGVAPGEVAVLPFGLEGPAMRREVQLGGYCPAGLAMFPEIVAPTCLEAAILASQDEPLLASLVTPHRVLTSETVARYYPGPECDELDWDGVGADLPLALPTAGERGRRLPKRAGFVMPYGEHDWYRVLAEQLARYASRLGIALEVIDSEASRRAERAVREREIAAAAAALIQPGDVIVLDTGGVTTRLAEILADRTGLTVITNSLAAFLALRDAPSINLILTGGGAPRDGEALVGPVAQNTLHDLRADRLFLVAAGLSVEFGVSHAQLGEVAVKQAMIRASREVTVLADHSVLGRDSVAQVTGIRSVHRVVTDAAVPAETHLALSRAGIEVVIAPAG